MLTNILLINIIFSCLLVEHARSRVYDLDILSQDIFGALKVDTFGIRSLPHREDQSAIDKLNDLLIRRTDSADPAANLDIIIEELIKDYKNNVPLDRKSFQAKRLVASLSTITDENLCSSYSYRILQACLYGIDSSVRGIARNEHLRRIDKILAYYIRKHVNDCRAVYFREFSRVSEQLDEIQVKYLDTFLNKAIENLINNGKIKGETRVERLYNAGKDELSGSFDLTSERIYDTLKELARGDPNERYLIPVEDEHTGHNKIKRERFDQLIDKYILQPCNYFKHQFEEDIFWPFRFDSMFNNQIQNDRTDFYEGLLKFRFCSFDLPNKYLIQNVVDYIELGYGKLEH